jgi:GEVED domain/Secretion system C-terminal sorting domain
MKSILFFSVLLSSILQAQSDPCTSSLGGGDDPAFIEIRINNTTFDHLTYSSLTSYYHSYPATGQTTASLVAGNSYDIYTSTSSEAVTAIWLDFNNNGLFEDQEYKLLTNSMITQNTSSFSVPSSVPSGSIRVRIRSRAYGSSILASNACSSFGSGETRDYVFQITNNSLSTSETQKVKNIKIYPNPAQDEINLESETKIDYVTISDFSGREFLKKDIGKVKSTLNISQLPKGNYIVTIYSGGGVKSSKFIKN